MISLLTLPTKFIHMLQIDDTLISLDIIEKKFICNIPKCHGQCCIDGDSGAPLAEGEKEEIEKALPVVLSELSKEAQRIIKLQGISYIDEEHEEVTSIINGRECVFTLIDKNGNCKCAFEKAWEEGKISFRKPVSCHLYPIRVKQYQDYKGVNYDQWDICKPARVFGEKEGVPLYVFLKEPLIRKFGEDWYAQLVYAAENLKIS